MCCSSGSPQPQIAWRHRMVQWIPGSHHPKGNTFLPLRARGCLGSFLPLLGLTQVHQEEKISLEKPLPEVSAELGGRFCLADWFLLSSRMFSPLWKTHSLGWSWWKEELGRHWGQYVLSSWRKAAGMCNPRIKDLNCPKGTR